MTLPQAILGFQLCFLALLLSAGSVWEPAACLAAASWMLWQATHRHRSRRQCALAILTVLVGPLADATLAWSGRVDYAGYWYDGGVPVWIFLLWGCFGFGLRRPFGWLLTRGLWPVWPVVAVGAPLAYLAGARLGAAELAAPLPLTLCAISLSWLMVLATLKLGASLLPDRPWAASSIHSGDSR